jgi:hypothetical protein
MGLFSNPPAVDSSLAKLIIADDNDARRGTEKALAKSQEGILALLEPGEEVRAITRKEPFSSELLVVTNQRLVRMKKGKRQWAPIPLSEVAETRIWTIDRARTHYMVGIDTHTSKMYAQRDTRRFDPNHHMQVEFDGPRDAQGLCAIVDVLVERSGRPL